MTRQKFGADLPEVHLKQMFLNMLPVSASEKLRERKDLITLQSYINEVDTDLSRLNDARLAKIQAQRMSTALKSGSRSPVNAVIEEQSGPAPPLPGHMTNGNDEIGKKLDTLMSALTTGSNVQPRSRNNNPSNNNRTARSKSPRGLDPAWEREGNGCLHCALKGNRRKACITFKKLLADNGDSLPTGYKGACEKWKEKRKTKVAAVVDVDEVELE